MIIAVVDDERPARSELSYLIRQCSEDVQIYEAGSSDELLKLMEDIPFDACFVDVDLGGAYGTTLASMIRNRQPGAKIIFATAYQEYAVKAFEIGAEDYILKPFDLERVRKAVQRITGSDEPAQTDASALSDRLMVSTASGFQIIYIRDIVYIETANRSCVIHTRDSQYTQNDSMGYFEQRLKGRHFYRAHKSYLVNLDFVEQLRPGKHGSYDLKLKDSDMLLPLSRAQAKEFRQMFGM